MYFGFGGSERRRSFAFQLQLRDATKDSTSYCPGVCARAARAAAGRAVSEAVARID